MDDLSEFAEDPERLQYRGFGRTDESSTDACRRVWFSKAIESNYLETRFVVRIECEMYITDDWPASYLENRSYSFNGVHLDVYDRQMDAIDSILFDDDTEHPRQVASVPLRLRTLREVELLLKSLEIAAPFHL